MRRQKVYVTAMDFQWLLHECSDPYVLERLFYFERYAWLSLAQGMCAVISLEGQIEDVNTHWDKVTCYTREDLQGSYLIEYIHFDDRERVLAELQKLITSDIGSTSFSFRFQCKRSKEKRLNWNVIFSPDHNAYFCTATDASSSFPDSTQLAYRDVLTGLNNRLALEEQLPTFLAEAADTGADLALFFIDLDGFKKVNDTLGHKAGDTLLVRAARRMRAVVGEQGAIFRLGGDEFIVMLPHCKNRGVAAALAGQLVDRLRTSYALDGEQVKTGASLGIAAYPHDAHTPETLLDCADKAMYQVKARGKNNFAFYEDVVTAERTD